MRASLLVLALILVACNSNTGEAPDAAETAPDGAAEEVTAAAIEEATAAPEAPATPTGEQPTAALKADRAAELGQPVALKGTTTVMGGLSGQLARRMAW